MKNRYQMLFVLVAGTFISAAHAKGLYDQSQLDQFERTNKCINCDLSNARISVNHSGANLEGSNLSGIGGIQAQQLNFSAANLKNANLSGAYLEFGNFSNADFTGAHIDGAYTRYANFSGAIGLDLKNAVDACSVILPDGTVTKDCRA